MKIILGSTSEDKKKILESALEEIKITAEVIAVEAKSEITNQPLDVETTQKGAENRAKNAKRHKPSADLWIGIEGGLHDYGEGYHLVTFACLIDQGSSEFIGKGTEIHLPDDVSKEVKKGGQFDEAIRLYAKDPDIDQNLITRETPFTEAIQNAFASYLKANGELIYRKKVNAVILNSTDQVLLLQLVNYGDADWNTPGGGIEAGEMPEEAIKRELSEELGTDKFEILEKSEVKNKYDFPDFVIVRSLKEGKRFRGQEQTQFIVRFTGTDDEIKFQEEEIRKHKWVNQEDLESHLIFPGQYENIKKILESSELNLPIA